MKFRKIKVILPILIMISLMGAYLVPASYQGTETSPAGYILSDSSNGDVYACPMHPEVTSDSPGTCSKCGMDLVLQKKEDKEQSSTYTCPMHPEVTSDKPGTCPKCGMDLIKKEDVKNDKGMMDCMDKHHMKHK